MASRRGEAVWRRGGVAVWRRGEAAAPLIRLWEVGGANAMIAVIVWQVILNHVILVYSLLVFILDH